MTARCAYNADCRWPLCLQNYLYAIGGNDGTASLETCERYDPHLNKWSSLPKMKTRRAGAGVAELNGYLYVIGTHIYAPILTHYFSDPL